MRKAHVLVATFVALLTFGNAYAQEPSEGTAAPAETSSETAPDRPAPVIAGSGQADYDLQLHELEDRLNELKEDVWGSKARLRMLWHQLMQDRIGGSRIIVSHVNELGGVFELVRISYTMDGNQIFAASTADMENLPRRNRMEIHDEPVLAGPHTIVVQAEIRGNDHGVFSYMNGYNFTLTSSHSFTLEDGKTADVDVVVYDHGGASRALEERPDVRYEVDLSDTVDESVSEGEGEDGGDA